MDIAEGAVGLFRQRAFVGRIGGETDMQIVAAARLEVTELRHRCISCVKSGRGRYG
jgi:hypothetical protein